MKDRSIIKSFKFNEVRRLVESMGGQIVRHGSRTYWLFKCSVCEVSFEKASVEGFNPDLAVKTARKKGWQAGYGQPLVCPAHPHGHAARRIEKGANIHSALEGDKSMPVPSMKITRDVMSMLESYFHADKGVYEGDWSDDKVASQAGTVVNVVVSIREEAFGKLKEPTEITKLRDDLIMFQLSVEETLKKCNADAIVLLNRLEKIAAKGKF